MASLSPTRSQDSQLYCSIFTFIPKKKGTSNHTETQPGSSFTQTQRLQWTSTTHIHHNPSPFPKYSHFSPFTPLILSQTPLPSSAMSQHISFFLLFFFHYLSALPVLTDPDPAAVQSQTLHRPPPATIPAFPEQSDISSCPLDLPEDLFHGVKSACSATPHHHHRSDPNFFSGDIHRTRCCPVLAAWLYSAYAKSGLRAAAKIPAVQSSYDMPILPDDSETCVDTLEKALGNKGVELRKPNETCDVVYCYCGIRLHPFSCPESFWVGSDGKLGGGEAVKMLEKDCFHGGYNGCSKCLHSLHLLNGDKTGRSNNRSERTSKMHNRDCELMGITWLLNKDRAAYIHTVSAVLRTLMRSKDEESSPTYCALNTDGMPLAVDSSEINDQSSSTSLTFAFLYGITIASSILFLFQWS